jgi:alkanesulfonate monooxygenase SsuD/methylene tetrahydromethanopterin reductase-like flavin-dependent oxidoreductase (luciferase family)
MLSREETASCEVGNGATKDRCLTRFGLSLPNRGVLFGATSTDELLEIAAVADASGAFDSVWVGDSLFAKPRLESLVLLSAIAARTQRVRLGTCCLSTFPLRDPIFLAAQWAALDQVSHGRMILGACIGGSLPREKAEKEFAPFKVKLSERGPRLEEGLTVLRRLWSEDHVSHQGRFYQFHDLTLEPKPVQKPCPPIWIATNPKPELTPTHVVDRALRRVGLMADGWMTDNTPVARFKERWDQIRDVAREAGRPTDGMESALHLMVNINDDRAAGFEESVKFLHTYYSPAMTREYIEGWLACGPAASVIAKIRAYVDVGCTTPILRFASWDQKGQLTRALAEVMPAVRVPD